MKILLAGGGTGGHFYPLIAIAEELNKIAEEQHFINFQLYYISNSPYNQQILDEQFITYIPITAGKLRVYFSFQNFVDMFKTGFGIIRAFFKIFSLYPDVVISKGGYAAFPTLCAAWFLRIPVIIHESDTVPGRVNAWSGKFARRVALSYPEAAEYFDARKISVTGQPVRKSVRSIATEGSKEYFELDPNIPTVGIMGGSGGSRTINNVITDLLPELVEKYQIIHQTGVALYDEVVTDARIILGSNVKRTHYKPYPYLNELQTKMFAGAADLVISRAGSTVFEIAAWGKPAILIPGSAAVFHGDHQKKNAYHYARTGAGVVIEEKNLTASILFNEIELILDHKERYDAMVRHAKEFFKPEAGLMIAAEAVKIALEHEQ